MKVIEASWTFSCMVRQTGDIFCNQGPHASKENGCCLILIYHTAGYFSASNEQKQIKNVSMICCNWCLSYH